MLEYRMDDRGTLYTRDQVDRAYLIFYLDRLTADEVWDRLVSIDVPEDCDFGDFQRKMWFIHQDNHIPLTFAIFKTFQDRAATPIHIENGI
jgi:hypothetical protein